MLGEASPLILWSDEINHSNFENATKCLNKSWWYLLKHAYFILKLKDFCNTCVHFQWKKQTQVDTIGILSALRMRGLRDKRQLLAKLRIAGSENSALKFLIWDVISPLTIVWDFHPVICVNISLLYIHNRFISIITSVCLTLFEGV